MFPVALHFARRFHYPCWPPPPPPILPPQYERSEPSCGYSGRGGWGEVRVSGADGGPEPCGSSPPGPGVKPGSGGEIRVRPPPASPADSLSARAGARLFHLSPCPQSRCGLMLKYSFSRRARDRYFPAVLRSGRGWQLVLMFPREETLRAVWGEWRSQEFVFPGVPRTPPAAPAWRPYGPGDVGAPAPSKKLL